MARLAFNDSAEVVDLAEYRRTRRIKDPELDDYERRYAEFQQRYWWLLAYEYKPQDIAYAQAWTECFAFD